MSDVIAKLVMDIADWVEPIMQAKDHLADIVGVTQRSIANIRQSVSSLSSIKSAIAGKLQAIDNGDSTYTVMLSTIRDLNRGMGSDTADAVAKQSSAHAAAVQSTASFAAATEKSQSSLDGLLGSIGQKAAIAYIAYKIAGEDVINTSLKHLQANSELRQSTGGLWEAISGLGSTISSELVGGVQASLNAVLLATTGFNDLTEVVDYGASTISSWARTATTAANTAKEGVREAGLVFGTALAIFHGADSGAAAAWYEEGKALNQMAEATANVIAKQEQMKSVMDFIKQSAAAAGAAQASAAEVAKIATIDNLDALGAAETAFRLRSQTVSADIQKSKAWQAEINQVNAALVRQRTAIEGGTVKKAENPVDKMIADAKKALAQTSMGDIGFAVDTAKQNNATTEQISQLRGLLEAKRDLTQQNAQQAATEKAIAEAQAQSAKRFEDGKARIASMRDQIDLLTGAATEADIVMRELSRQGFDDAQIAEMGKLTAELESLKDKPKSGGSDRQGDNSAALRGSAAAAELVVRGVGGGGNKLEKLTEQQNAKFDDLINATKENRPQPIQAANV